MTIAEWFGCGALSGILATLMVVRWAFRNADPLAGKYRQVK